MASESPHTWFLDDEGADERAERSPPQRYRREEELGRGGFGRVIRAWDLALEREVAIKEVLSDAPPSAVRRFLDEAKLTAALEHPHIVPIHDAGQWTDGTLYYVMRLVRGRNLYDAIQASPSLDRRLRLLPHVEDVVQAMAFAHAQGVLHRDLKPANILLGEHGETLLVDWGIARLLDEHRPGAVEGTPAYMSPEQARGEVIDARSDVWSLGAVLFELVAGVPPFHGADPRTLLERVRTRAPPRLREQMAEAPPELAAIVDRALQVDPRRRYASAAELAAELAAFRDGRRVQAHRYPFTEMLALIWRQHARTILGLGVGLLLALLAATIGVIRVSQEKERALHAEAQTATLLADALLEQAEQAWSLDEPLRAARLSLGVLRIREDPRARGILALTRDSPTWTVTRVPTPPGCRPLPGRGEALFCRTEDGLRRVDEGAGWIRERVDPREVALSPEGTRLLAASEGAVHTLDARDGRDLQPPLPGTSRLLRWREDGGAWAAAQGSRVLLQAGATHPAEFDARSVVQSLEWLDDERLLVVVASGWVSRLRLAEGPTPQLLAEASCPLPNSVAASGLSPDRAELVWVGFDQRLRRSALVDCATTVEAAATSPRVRSLRWLGEPGVIVGADEEGALWTWSEELRLLERRRMSTTALGLVGGEQDPLLAIDRTGALALGWRTSRAVGRLLLAEGPSGLETRGEDLWLSIGNRVERRRVDTGRVVETRRFEDPLSGFTLLPSGEAAQEGRVLHLRDPRGERRIELSDRGTLDLREPPWGLVSLQKGGIERIDTATDQVRRVALPEGHGLVLARGSGWWVNQPGSDWLEVDAEGRVRPVEGTRDLRRFVEAEGGGAYELREGELRTPTGRRVEAAGGQWIAPLGRHGVLLVLPDRMEVWEPDGTLRATLPGHAGRMFLTHLQGDRLWTVSWDGEIRSWDLSALRGQVGSMAAGLDELYGAESARTESGSSDR